MTKIPLILFLVLAFLFALLASNKYHKKIETNLKTEASKALSDKADGKYAKLPLEFNYLKGQLDTEGLNKNEKKEALKLVNKALPGGWIKSKKSTKTQTAKPKPTKQPKKPTDNGGKADTPKAGSTAVGIAGGDVGDDAGKGGGDVTVINPEKGDMDKPGSDPKDGDDKTADPKDGDDKTASVEPKDGDDKDGDDKTASSDPKDGDDKDGEPKEMTDADKEAAEEASAIAHKALKEALSGAALTFAPNSAKLSNDHKEAVTKLAKLITDFGKPVNLDVKGFAQDDCDTCLANELSNARADAVISALLRAGVPAASLKLEPLPGPVGESADGEKSAQRRVELNLVP